MNSCAAKPVSFVSLAAIIFFLCHLDKTRKLPPFGSEETPARNGNKGIRMAECVGRSVLELRIFPLFGSKEIPTRNRNKRSQMARVCQEVKFGAEEIPAI
jgi:hypothetical protein